MRIDLNCTPSAFVRNLEAQAFMWTREEGWRVCKGVQDFVVVTLLTCNTGRVGRGPYVIPT